MTGAGDAPPFAFVEAAPVAAALDRADDLRGDAAALAEAWRGARILGIDAEGRALATPEGALRALDPANIPYDPARALFLGLDAQGRAWFALEVGGGIDPGADASEAAAAGVPAPAAGGSGPSRAPRIDLRTAAAAWPASDAAAFAAASATLHWRRRHRHCGACGHALAFSRGGWLGHCEGCGLDHYPRTDPAVIVAVGDGDRLLLGRQAAWPAGRYSVIAGFVEPGETLEQTVAREVHEETAVRVRDCRYLASQPWPFPGALMLGFIAEAEPGGVPRASDELEHARWFEKAEIEAALAAEARGAPEQGPFLLPSRVSIAHWLVRRWLASRGR